MEGGGGRGVGLGVGGGGGGVPVDGHFDQIMNTSFDNSINFMLRCPCNAVNDKTEASKCNLFIAIDETRTDAFQHGLVINDEIRVVGITNAQSP